jgi:hypothetical protein
VICIQEVPDSNLGPGTDYPEFMVFFSPNMKMQDSTSTGPRPLPFTFPPVQYLPFSIRV